MDRVVRDAPPALPVVLPVVSEHDHQPMSGEPPMQAGTFEENTVKVEVRADHRPFPRLVRVLTGRAGALRYESRRSGRPR